MSVELKTAFVTMLVIFAMAAAALSTRHRAPQTAEQIVQHTQAQKIVRPMAPFRGLGRELSIPVDGVRVNDLADTWGAARSEGRTHEGIDIMAPAGTPVRAAANGRILKFFRSERGGLTIYQLDSSGHAILYYGHLMAYEPMLREGENVQQGQLIAYVGSTGNATTPHLHFEVQRANAGQNWWQGKATNPYPLLRAGRLPR